VVFGHFPKRWVSVKLLDFIWLSFGPNSAIKRTTMMRRTLWRVSAWAAAALLVASITPARAQDPDDQKRGVARISVANGEVSVRRGDSGDWVAAIINAPLLTGDQISTAPNSRAEVEFDSGNALRIGGDAVVVLSQLEYNRYQMAVERGTVTFRVLRASNADIEVDTPNVSARPSKQGIYRIVVNDTESDVTARAGDVEVFTPRGSQWVNAGQMLEARGTAADPEFQMARALPSDEWDRWNDSRDRPFTASKSGQYVPPGVYGTEDLDPYGTWVNVPQYGEVWQPTEGPDWAPYQSGRWVWLDWYGWTWVSYDPWGWAPYHYGRWFNQPGYGWLWYPGVIGVRHYWSPALVGFFGFGGGVGVGFGFGNIGWVPLAPYEVFHPWWGRAYYGRPGYFGGVAASVNVIGTFRNAGVRNGFTAVSGEDFRAGRFQNMVRPSGEQLRQASSVNGPIPVAPDRANLRFSDRPVASSVRAAGNANVYSYRQPTPVQRLSFQDQQRGFSGGGSLARPSVAPTATTPSVHSEPGGWQRFGAPRVSQTSPRAEQPQVQTTTPSANSGWSRFGDPGAARPQPAQAQPRSDYRNYAAPAAGRSSFNSGGSQPESLRITPPVVRERASAGSAPRPQSNSGSRSGGGNRGGGGGHHR
jgi:hypothetical protein